jgi:hypothetical protein
MRDCQPKMYRSKSVTVSSNRAATPQKKNGGVLGCRIVFMYYYYA